MVSPTWGQGDRALLRVEPLPSEKRGGGSGGLFIGVNEFIEGSSLRLRFAVDDAIAQAHVFVVELGLLEARKTVLLISGEPTMPVNRDKLERLQERGVFVGQALRGPILAHLRRTVQGVDQDGLFGDLRGNSWLRARWGDLCFA
ncbi:MAG: hypothetical protein LR015_13810 [Verrucomicrobia bacterium]|nr:hypothetical protein [Verrucomicrobiota bacterium]